MSWDLNVTIEQNNWDIEVVDGQAIINLTVEGQNVSLALQAAYDAQQSALSADQSAQEALQSAQDASDSADDALLSEQNALQSAQNALTSEQNALQSEQAALLSEQNATQSEQAALLSEQNASQSALDALTSEQNALQSASDAQDSADLAQQYAESIDVLGTVLTGFTVGVNSTILSTDTVLGAFNKVQSQINNIPVQNPVTIGTANGLSLLGQQLSLGLASSTANGALSSTDWSTFNGKQNTLSLTTSGSSGASTLVGSTLNIPNYTLSGLGGVPTSRTLTINGTSFDLSADRSWTIAAGIGGTIASGQVAFGTASNTIGGSNNLFWDSVNGRLGIGTNSPAIPLQIGVTPTASLLNVGHRFMSTTENSGNALNLTSANEVLINRPVFQGVKSRGTLSSPTAVLAGDFITTFLSGAYDGSAIQFSAGLFFDAESNASTGNAPQQINLVTGTTGANRTTKLQVRSNGNVIIQNGGTFTDSGFRLDVNGTARVQGDLTISDTRNIILATTTGTKIGTSTSQKLSFWNATPVTQRSGDILTALSDLGLVASPTLSQNVQALGSISGSQTINLSNGTIITATLTNDISLSFSGLPASGKELSFSLRFAGIFQITFPVGTKFANDIAPTLEAPLYELPCSIDSAGNVIVYGAINKIDTI